MKSKRTYMQEKDKISWVLGLILALVPLIVRMKVMEVPEEARWLWGQDGAYLDFFSANKLLLLGILTIVAVAMFFIEYDDRFKMSLIFKISIVAYIGLTLISTLVIPKGYKMVGLIGAPGRYEGFIAVLIYMVLLCVTIRAAQNISNIKVIYIGLMLNGLIMSIIGLTQFFGIDILQSDGGKALILPFEYLHYEDDLKFTFNSSQDYTVYGTLFHSNYVGSYTAMLLPISIVSMIYTYLYSSEIDKKIKSTALTALLIVLWITSHSRGGLLGGAFALLVIVILLGSYIIKTKKQFFIIIGIFIATFFGLNIASKGTILRQVVSLPKEIKGIFEKAEDVQQLKDIRLEADAVEIDSQLPTIRIEKDNDKLVLKDSDGNVIQTSGEEKLILEDERYKNMNIDVISEYEFRVNISNPDKEAFYPIYLVYTEEGYKIVGGNKELVDIEEVESWGFEGKETLGSARGYIWSRTIPMIKNKWLFGHGLDTYPLYFPQNDVIGKCNAYNTPLIIVDKPHNIYLQTMVSTGIPSFIALVVLFIAYVVLFIKDLRRLDKDDIQRWISIGVFAAICGYLVSGLFNDSVISVAPIFWILWGVGIGLTQYNNYKQSKA